MFASAFSVLTRTWSKSMLTVWSDLNSPIFMLSFIRRSLSLGLVWIWTHCPTERHCITVFSFFIRLWYDSDLNGDFVEWGGVGWIVVEWLEKWNGKSSVCMWTSRFSCFDCIMFMWVLSQVFDEDFGVAAVSQLCNALFANLTYALACQSELVSDFLKSLLQFP